MRSVSFIIALALAATPVAAQVRTVSLEEAIALADRSSESIEIARAAVARANGQQIIARSQFLPQLNMQASYARTLASQFEGFSFGGPDTNTFRSLCAPAIPPTATPAERQAALDQARTCAAVGGGPDFSSVGFGALNQWTFGLQFSQSIFSGGRNTGMRTAAGAGRRVADIELTAQRAQNILEITQAYYNTVLADRLASIAEATVAMSDAVLRQTTRARQVGSTSEFELIRAQVARDNQVPVMLQRQSERTIAMLRLKQMLELPLDDSLVLTTSIDDAPVTPMAVAMDTAARVAGDTAVDSRATVRQSEANVRAQEGLLRAARADRWPNLSLTSGYQRLFFPQDVFPQFSDYRENWTIGVTANVALFSGGRIRGSVLQAQANLREARARHLQTREFAALDSRIALNQLAQAEAMFRASQGTAEQARRAYSIDEIRYREGISTQTDLTQSRLLVEQAMVNRAVAARDLAVARMRVALLKDLPLGASGAGVAPQAGAMSAPMTPTPQAPGVAASAPISGSNQQ
ncbi:MAG TPA: TolC family protein [Gemmatimonadaceae bacterium]|nr:TolC family protein [Gemmatimonadaceae bacterium]